jgi:hypothetical protein
LGLWLQGADPAIFKTFQAQTEGAQQGPGMMLVYPQGRANVAANAVERPALAQRPLQCGEHLADLSHKIASAAQVDRTLAAVVAVGEAIVRAKGLATAAAPRGHDRALACEQAEPGGDRRIAGCGSWSTDLQISNFCSFIGGTIESGAAGEWLAVSGWWLVDMTGGRDWGRECPFDS